MSLTEQELLDRAEITDALVAYCQAQDQNAWPLYARAFTADATIAFPGMGMEPMAASVFRDFLIRFNETRLSGQHLIGNSWFEISGDEACVVSEAIYITLHPTDTPGRIRRVRGNALYTDRCRRTAEGWRIAERVIAQKNVEVDEGDYDPALLEAIRAAAATDWFTSAGAGQ
ncbi:MAG TPA: nuclear transport factor 2 family protein [Novosphingobium sp.]|nr:nuclear transport factor 2 family protein [Novosphingobium sp.]